MNRNIRLGEVEETVDTILSDETRAALE